MKYIFMIKQFLFEKLQAIGAKQFWERSGAVGHSWKASEFCRTRKEIINWISFAVMFYNTH